MRSILIIIMLFMSNAVVASPDVAEAVRNNILDNLKYLQDENPDKAMSTMHSQSPSYLSTKSFLTQMLGNYHLSYELVSFKFIANDGDLVYVRVKQSTRKISGPAFRNNEIDMVQIFRKELGVWKLWSQANIGIKYLN